MLQPYQFCPNCIKINKMSVSVSFKNSRTPEGEPEQILVLNYHCDSCQAFVDQVPIDGIQPQAKTLFTDRLPSIPPM